MIAPQEAGKSPPLPSFRLGELARVALSWDVPRGGVLGTEPLGEVAIGSFGSERLPPEALREGSPDTPMGGLGTSEGGLISEETGSRLGRATVDNSRPSLRSSTRDGEEEDKPSPSRRGQFERELTAMQGLLAKSMATRSESNPPLNTSPDKWPKSWSAVAVAAGRFLAHALTRLRTRCSRPSA